MEENGWLRHLLENMQKDIDEIKDDVKHLSEWKWKIAGGVTVVSVFVTVIVNILHVWAKQ